MSGRPERGIGGISRSTLEGIFRLRLAAKQGDPALIQLLVPFAQVAQFIPSAFGVSPNSQYVAGTKRWWQTENGLRGADVVLVDVTASRVLWEAKTERPEVVSVADSGRVLVEDWGWENLRSSAACFSLAGELLWRHSFEANSCRSGISREGDRAFIATAHNRERPLDSCQVFVLDGESGVLLWRRTLFPPCAPHVRFEFCGHELSAVDEGRGTERLVREWLHPDD